MISALTPNSDLHLHTPPPSLDSLQSSDEQAVVTQQAQEYFTRITDITLCPNSSSFSLIVAPIIRSLSQNNKDRWITWIGTDKLNPEVMRQHGLDIRELRVINTRADEDSLWATWEALAQGNSDLVIAQFSQTQSQNLAHLQHAAELGHCHALLLTRYTQKL